MIYQHKNVISTWKKIEDYWPVSGYQGKVDFEIFKDKTEEFLIKKEVFPQAFSHYGFVAYSIERFFRVIKKFDAGYSAKIIKDWVEAYKVYVGRILLNGKELELIEPVGESFFYTFLKEEGECLHHLSFYINDIEDCFEKLKAQGVEIIDKEPRLGSHGKIVFLMPKLFGKICIELCEEYK